MGRTKRSRIRVGIEEDDRWQPPVTAAAAAAAAVTDARPKHRQHDAAACPAAGTEDGSALKRRKASPGEEADEGKRGVLAVFLDIDGVLLLFGGPDKDGGEEPDGTFCPRALAALNSILVACPRAELVLSSTWRCAGGQPAVIAEFQRWAAAAAATAGQEREPQKQQQRGGAAAGGRFPLGKVASFEHITDPAQHDFRQWEIASWLQGGGAELAGLPTRTGEALTIAAWVALDDEELVEPRGWEGVTEDSNGRHRAMFRGHVVKTRSEIGLTDSDARHAIAILRGELPPTPQRP